jgi:3-methyladenine DNA glycosylase/8-oxoguanine DNA glycosylase
MPRSLTLSVPRDYLLHRDVCSYGYFLLAPSDWSPTRRVYTRALEVDSGGVLARVCQGDGPSPGEGARRPARGTALSVSLNRSLTAAECDSVRAQLSRMLRLDEPAPVIAQFHRLDPRWKRSGRGRLMRSPSLWEDMVKTITSCNVAWPNTVNMNTQLCRHYGLPAGELEGEDWRTFPAARKVARLRPGNLRGRCRVGYRDVRIVEMARLFARGSVDPAWFESPATSDDDVRGALLELPGIGPYAAANVMQLLGRYAHLPLDSESVRHARTVLGMKGSQRELMKRVEAHFAPFGAHRFRSYWFELWAFYEAKRGPSWTWERRTTGKTFTASQL